MLFKELKSGYPIYLFDRANATVTQGKVVSVTAPHYDNHYGNPMDMVVDVTAEFDGTTKAYTFKENVENGYVGNIVISSTREGVLREVSAFKAQLDQDLSQVDKKKEASEKCGVILTEFDPALKEKKETETRFAQIEKSLENYGSDVRELKELMKGFVKELKG